jgi:hypothetical protein
LQEAKDKESSRQLSFWWLLFPLIIGVLCWRFFSRAGAIASSTGEEPFDFLNGISIWPSEGIRFLAIIGGVCFIWYAWCRHTRHRQKLWIDYFCGRSDDPSLWESFLESSQSRLRFLIPPRSVAGRRLKNMARQTRFVFRWMPPLFVKITNRYPHETKVSVNAVALFRSYLHRGSWPVRFARVVFGMAVYFVALWSSILCLHGRPTQLLIRGSQSHHLDRVVGFFAILVFLLVLFYVLDAALLTARLLNCISSQPTSWPDRTLRAKALGFGVPPEHLDGLLKVDFAAVQTKEVGPLMFGPVVILLLIVISRSSFLDDFTWPPGLIAVFALNSVLAAICWGVVRSAAKKVRKCALAQLAISISSVKHSGDDFFAAPMTGSSQDSQMVMPKVLPHTCRVSKKDYLRRLKLARKAVQDEHRGAYARAFQDPSYLAVFIPTGATGVISLLAEYWLNK